MNSIFWRKVQLRKVAVVNLCRSIISTCRLLLIREFAQVEHVTDCRYAGLPFLTFFMPRYAFEARTSNLDLLTILGIIQSRTPAKVLPSIIQRVSVFVVRFFMRLTSENYSMHSEFDGPTQFSTARMLTSFHIETIASFTKYGAPVPTIQPFEVDCINDGVLPLRQRDQAIGWVKRLNDLVSFHRAFHWSSWKGLVKFSRHFLIFSLFLLIFCSTGHAQLARWDSITLSPSGLPVSVNVSVCNSPGLATTASQVTGNAAILTMASNPITAGFVANQSIVVSGFTGGDTYFNSGTLAPFTSTVTITAVSATTIIFPLTHANASASTNGSVFQLGTGSTPCAPLASIFSNAAGTISIAQPGLTSSGTGNVGFFVAAGNYGVEYSGSTIGSSLQPVTLSCPLNATCTFKNINAIQFADQFTASALTAPTLAPAIGNVVGGGTVANNTYACEITFQGTAGETTATPTSGTTVTGGGSSSLQCGPLDVPTGAVSYNVYWQTGGAGNYFAGHTAVALNNTDSQTTTPATSGAQPPVSNTATSQLAAAQGALSGGAGSIYIPSTVTANAGAIGSLAPNQSMFDFRTGAFSSRIQTPNLSNQKGTIGAVPSTGWNLDYLIPTALGSFQEAVPLQVTAHLQSAGTVSYWGGINSVGGGLTTAGFGFVRDAARSENAWALTASANCNSTNGTCAGMEIDGTVNNTPVDTCSGGCNLILGANGQRNFEGIRFTSLNGTAAYKVGIDIQPNMYTVNGLLVGGSTTAGSIGVVSFNSTPATGGAFLGQASATNPNAFIADNAVAAQPTCYLWRNAGSVLWQMCQDASLNFANYDVSNASLARIQWNTGANGANIYNTPGTGVHAFNNPIRLNEVAGATCTADAGATFDTICGDSATHTPSWNNNANGFSSPTGAWQCTNVTPVTLPGTSTTNDQNLMACTIPAGTLNRVGRTLRVKVKGVYSTPAASTSQMTIKLKLCTVSGCGSGTVISPIAIQSTALGTIQITNDNFSLRSEITTQTAGASSAYEASGEFLIDLSTLATAADSEFGDTNVATVGTIDSTAQLFLQTTMAFSSASVSNVATQRQLIAETVN